MNIVGMQSKQYIDLAFPRNEGKNTKAKAE